MERLVKPNFSMTSGPITLESMWMNLMTMMSGLGKSH